ncbi:hypothetical protein [Flexibacterium corallicola]|uniref:hypothetical protein n=1 Tax=Flexibacterium corallicola TaxID=3037259 RepID=UPI00286F020A|nr:hypothetical protein [Pseudovibrio sp. M1P-2-3]
MLCHLSKHWPLTVTGGSKSLPNSGLPTLEQEGEEGDNRRSIIPVQHSLHMLPLRSQQFILTV